MRTHGWGVHAGWGPSGWFTDPALAGGGALIDMGIHAIDTARFLLGDPEPSRVGSVDRRSVSSATTVDDDGVVTIDWNGGVRSTVEFGWWQPRLGGLEADTEGARHRRHRPHLDDAAASAGRLRPLRGADVSPPSSPTSLLACRTGAEPIASSAVGRTALSIVEQAYRHATIPPPTPPER